MAITISGVNNNDRIVATDGTIDALSGFNVTGVITATSFTGNLDGNITGNVTGNINNTTLLLQTSGTERIRITGNNEIGIAGANYGSAGQVLTSGGSGSAVSWTTINQGVTSDGSQNTVGGSNAGDSIISGGTENTVFGYNAGTAITNGDSNTFFGSRAGRSVSTGLSNTGVGYNVMGNASGTDNAALGSDAGNGMGDGRYHVAIGKGAFANTNQLGSQQNNIVIGYLADVSANNVSNEMTLGNTNINHVRIPGIGVSFSEGGAVISGIVTATSYRGDGSQLTGVSVGGASTVSFNNNVPIYLGDNNDYKIYFNNSKMSFEPTHSGTQQFEMVSNNQMYIHAKASGLFLRASNQEVISIYGGSGGGVYFRHNGTQKLKLEGGNWTYENSATVTHASHVYIPDSIIHVGDTNTKIRFPAADTFSVETAGSERLRIDSSGRLSFAGDTDTYIHHPEDNELAITVSGGSTPIVRFGTGGSNSTVGIKTDTTLVTNGEALSIRGYTSIKSLNDVYAALYTHNEDQGNGNICAHILLNVSGANRGGFGYGTDNSTLIMGNQNAISFRTGSTNLNGTERLLIKNTGGVGINTSLIRNNRFLNIAAPSQDYSNSSTELMDGGGICLQHTDSLASTNRTYPGIFWSGNTASLGRARAGILGVTASNNDATDIVFLTRYAANGTGFYPSDERLRITSGGRILGGNHLNDRGAVLQIESSNHAMIGIHRNTNDHGAPAMNFSASRGTSAGSNTIVQSGDYLGLIRFSGADGSDLATGAMITGIVDGTPGSNDMPTRLGFWTSADGSQSPTERLRIDSSGYITKFVVPSWNLRPYYSSTQTTANTSSHHAIGWSDSSSGGNTTSKATFLQNCTLHGSGWTYNLHNGQNVSALRVPVAGRYYVNVTYRVENNPNQGNIYVYVNGSQIARQHVEMWAHRPYMHCQWASVLNLAKDDEIIISISCPNANVSGRNDNVNWFSGYLIG